MKTTRPNIVRIAPSVYRLDLRRKAFQRILQTISNGKQTLEFPTKAAAERKANEVDQLLAEYGSKKLETLEAVMRIDPLDLQARLTPYGKTIQDAVTFYAEYLKEKQEAENSQTLGSLMDEWLAEKKKRVEENTLRHVTYESLYYKAAGYKKQWGERPVATITAQEIREWVESLKVWIGPHDYQDPSQTSKKHQLGYLSQFFIWSKKTHGVPKENPCSSVVIQIDEAAGEVKYFTPEQAAQIMTLSTSKRFLALLPFHAICMFSGVRTAECERLTWNNIDFDDKTIVLISAHAKTRGRRIAMSPNLVKWLEWFHTNYNQYPLTPSQGFRDKKRQFRKQLGLKWPSNGMRHSAASYTLGAKIGDYGYLEEHFGNSRTMLQRYYLNFPSKDVSLKFWDILPPQQTPLRAV